MRRRIGAIVVAAAAASTVMVGGAASPTSAATWNIRDLTAASVTPNVIGQELAGEGVTVVSTSFSGDPRQAGLFSDAADAIGITDGVVLSSGAVADVVGPNNEGGKTTAFFGPGDPGLTSLAGGVTRDAAVFEMTFVPVSTDLEINYVFASEEYKEYVGTSFNDVFAFFVNGENCATVAEADGLKPVAVNTINHERNAQIYVDNPTSAPIFDTQFDGFTQVLTCFATVNPGVSNTLRLAIADTSDAILDSAVFIETSGVTSTPKTRYTPVPPARAFDTRGGAKVGDGQIVSITLAGTHGIPADALSVALNVTSTESDADGFLTVFPKGQSLPVASNVNYTAGSSVPNLVVARLGDDGAISIFAERSTHVVVDVFGFFGTSAANGFQAGSPFRALDTRPSGVKLGQNGVITFQVAGVGGVPAGVPAVAMNLTLDQPDEAGFASVFASGNPVPQTSNVNVGFGETRPNVVFAPVGPDGQVSVYVSMGAHVIADVFGWYTPASDAELFKAVNPKRIIDTRQSDPVPAGGELLLKVTDIVGVPSTATAVVLNVTVTGPVETGFLTVHAANLPRPETSNVNYVADKTVPNVVVTGVSPDGRIKVFAYGQTHVIVDVAGWYG